jgi:2-keto-4-pentenoate hydratase/2-oxohepta-3-ene-1,7-dioic acid hydratase in catechol pathway
MRLMMFEYGGAASLGVVDGDEVVAIRGDGIAADLEGVIAGGADALQAVQNATQNGARSKLSDVKPALPIARPPKMICVGLNYALHAAEGGHDTPKYPAFFLRVTRSLIPAEADVVRPKCSEQLDYECELAIVIGKGGRHISEADALDHVFGYTLFNDVSVRDFQRKGGQWTAGKNFDNTGPLGPVVVTSDELPPGASGLRISTRVNGKTMQDSDTGDMIFSTQRIVSLLSEFMTLEPGDVIATGTPSGVAHARKPPAWMKDGDVVEVEIEGVGVLRNPIVDEV